MSLSKAITSAKCQWPGGSSIKQNFSLPFSIIYYISKNPSTPKCYSKFIQTCKYFFEKKQILVIAYLFHNGTMICANEDCKVGECCIEFNIEKTAVQIWLTNGRIYLNERSIPNYTSFLCSKIYQCNFTYLDLAYDTITVEHFKLLVPCIKWIDLYYVKITDNDGSCVMLEKIIEAIPNLEKFDFFMVIGSPVVNASTIKKIIQLKNLGNLKSFRLGNIPQIFDVQDISDFVQSYKDTSFLFGFLSDVSDDYLDEVYAMVEAVKKDRKADCRLSRWEYA